MLIVGLSTDPADLPAEREWVRTFWDALLPHSAGAAGYVNGLTDYADERVRAVYGPKYQRLAEIKATYDPTNMFRGNAEHQTGLISPVGRGRDTRPARPAGVGNRARSPAGPRP